MDACTHILFGTRLGVELLAKPNLSYLLTKYK